MFTTDVQILIGDCREKLRELPDGSVHCCVTSPPYFGLRDYGHESQIGLEPTPDEFVAAMVEVFREVRRALRDDGTLWVNIGDSYSSGGRRTRDTDEKLPERGSAPRPLDGCKPKDLIGIPWMVAFALRADGWFLRQDIIWNKPNTMPESVRDRCTKAHEYMFLLSKSPRYYFDSDAIAEGATNWGARNRAGKYEGGETGLSPHRGLNQSGEREIRNKRSVWTVNTAAFADAHFATYPPALIEPCILAGCPEGGTVLDPFFGAGTTGLVARRLGRNAIGVELNPKYAAIARRRLEQDEMGEHSRKRARAAIKAEAAAPLGGLFA